MRTRRALPVLLLAAGALLSTVGNAAAEGSPGGGGKPTVYLGPYATVQQCLAVRAEVGSNAITWCIDYSSDPNGPAPAGPGYYFQAYS